MRRNPSIAQVEAEYEEYIREGMARTLWLLAFADWAEEVGWDGRPSKGGDWDDVAPETPDAALKAADALISLIAQNEGLHGPSPMAALFQMAMEIDDGEPFSFPTPDVHDRQARDNVATAADLATEFGSCMAHEGVGSGVNWCDDHTCQRGAAKFELKRISFEVRYDGVYLDWSGGNAVATTTYPDSSRIGRIHVVNANDRSWTRNSYLLAFGAYGNTLLLAYANSLDVALDECIDWLVENEPGHIIDDQVNEEYQAAIAEGLDEEEAMERAEEDTTSGGNAGNHINSSEWTIVAENPTPEQLAELGGDEAALQRLRRNPTRRKHTTAEHTELKQDDAAWQALPYVGIQHTSDDAADDEAFEVRNCPCGSTLLRPLKHNCGMTRNGGGAFPSTPPPSSTSTNAMLDYLGKARVWAWREKGTPSGKVIVKEPGYLEWEVDSKYVKLDATPNPRRHRNPSGIRVGARVHVMAPDDDTDIMHIGHVERIVPGGYAIRVEGERTVHEWPTAQVWPAKGAPFASIAEAVRMDPFRDIRNRRSGLGANPSRSGRR